jgi:glycosyltransferase involved in cell wall biosynthesis
MFDIVMPLFNKEIYVGRTIEAVLAQTLPDWRLYVIDDGSKDDGAAVVERFADPRITIIRQSNSGPGAARNTGIVAGEAEWIAFLDADDVWLPNHLSVLDQVRKHFQSAGLIGAAYRHWDGGDVPEVRNGPTDARLVRYFHEASRGRSPFFTSSAAVRREAIEKVGLLKPVTVGDETELWARLALNGPVAASSSQTVLYRVGTGGITDSSALTEATGIEQVSLPVGTLLERLGAISDEKLKKDVRDYIDYEVGIVLLRAVRTGQIDYARRLLDLFVGRPHGKAAIAALLARLPAPLGQRLLLSIFAIKRASRSVAA